MPRTWKGEMHVFQTKEGREQEQPLGKTQPDSPTMFMKDARERNKLWPELKQVRDWEKHPVELKPYYKTLLPNNLGTHYREWPAGKANVEVQMLVEANSKPHDIVIYTGSSVTRDRSGWGFTVKQGGRAVHEDSGAHRVTTSSLTMEVETVTHAIQWLASQRDAQITHVIILTDSMNLLQKVESGMGCPD